jgi:hypothetical protein
MARAVMRTEIPSTLDVETTALVSERLCTSLGMLRFKGLYAGSTFGNIEAETLE